MTWKMKIFLLWFYEYQAKARNQGNTVKATNLVIDPPPTLVLKLFYNIS